jgi:hypothetical protein
MQNNEPRVKLQGPSLPAIGQLATGALQVFKLSVGKNPMDPKFLVPFQITLGDSLSQSMTTTLPRFFAFRTACSYSSKEGSSFWAFLA